MYKIVLLTFTLTLLLTLSAVIGCATSPSAAPHLTPEVSPEPGNSPIEIIIYTDFQCGACAKLHSEVEPELRERYIATGKAQIEIRLLAAISIDSMRAAQAALCAGDQGRFLEYQDALFRAWREEDADAYSTDQLVAMASSLGLDAVAFRSCLDSSEKKAEVEQNMNLAKADGVRVLPAVIIDGTKLEGYKLLDTYIQVIERALATTAGNSRSVEVKK